MAALLRSLVILCLCVLCIDGRVIKRSTEILSCSASTPCGWEVYEVQTRTVAFYVESPCTCSSGTQCRSHTDDISISALVYRCKRRGPTGQALALLTLQLGAAIYCSSCTYPSSQKCCTRPTHPCLVAAVSCLIICCICICY